MNGLIFSTSVAWGWSNQSTSSYANVIISPVFWQFESNNLRLELRSALATSIAGSTAISAFNDQKSTALINSRLNVSTSHLEPSSGSKFINLLSLKLLTANPVLNLSNPSASLTWKDFVSSSSAFNDVTVSKLMILFSSAAISLIVNLRLSCILIFGWRSVS